MKSAEETMTVSQVDTQKSEMPTPTNSPRLLPFRMEKIRVVENDSCSEGRFYEFKLGKNTNLPLVVASPAFQVRVCAEQGKSPGTHSYNLIQVMIRVENLCRRDSDTLLHQFLTDANDFCDGLVETAKNTVKLGAGLCSEEKLDSYHWMAVYTWFKLLNTPVTIYGKHNQVENFKGILYQVKWYKEELVVEGIRDDNKGMRLYKDGFHPSRIVDGDYYILERDVV